VSEATATTAKTPLEPRAGADLQSPFFNRIALPIIRFSVGLLFLLIGPLRVTGKYRVPKTGGVLILSNHLADLDPPVVHICCPRTIYFMSKSELSEMPVLGRILRWFRTFSVKRGEPDRNAIRVAVAYLKAGQAVGVFPEGELSETGELLPLKSGMALIARMAEVPVICCGLKGTNKMLPYGRLLPKPAFGGVTVNWGEARRFDRHASADEIMAWAEGQFRELTDQA